MKIDNHIYEEDKIKKKWLIEREQVSESFLLYCSSVLNKYIADLNTMPKIDLILDVCIIHMMQGQQNK